MKEKTSFFEKFWYLFVLLAVISLGIIAGLWLYNQKNLENKANQIVPETTYQETIPEEGVDSQTLELETQSDSDEIEAIETDLQNTNLNNIDKETSLIEREIFYP